MTIHSSQLVGDEHIVKAGSQIEAKIQDRNVVLPVDMDFTAPQILNFMNTLSPSLNGKYIAEVSTDLYRVISEGQQEDEIEWHGPFTITEEEMKN